MERLDKNTSLSTDKPDNSDSSVSTTFSGDEGEEFELIDYSEKTVDDDIYRNNSIKTHDGESSRILIEGKKDEEKCHVISPGGSGNNSNHSDNDDFEILDLDSEPFRWKKSDHRLIGKDQDRGIDLDHDLKNKDQLSGTVNEGTVTTDTSKKQNMDVYVTDGIKAEPRSKTVVKADQKFEISGLLMEGIPDYSLYEESEQGLQKDSGEVKSDFVQPRSALTSEQVEISDDESEFTSDISLAKDIVSKAWISGIGLDTSAYTSGTNSDTRKPMGTSSFEDLIIPNNDNMNIQETSYYDNVSDNNIMDTQCSDIKSELTVATNEQNYTQETEKRQNVGEHSGEDVPIHRQDTLDEEVSQILGIKKNNRSNPVSGDEEGNEAVDTRSPVDSPVTVDEGRGRSRHRRTVREVKEAMKKLKGGGFSDKDRPHSYHGDVSDDAGVRSRSGSRRRYDWNTTHFFPDIHDPDTVNRTDRRNRYSDYIEESWVHDLNTSPTTTTSPTATTSPIATSPIATISPVETTSHKVVYSIPVLHETMATRVANKENQPPLKSGRNLEMCDSTSGPGEYPGSSDGEPDSPQMWTKSPLHTNRKKRKERPLSQEVNTAPLAIPISRTGVKLGSPGIQRPSDKLNRRPSAPNMGTKVTPRKYASSQASDDMQDKYDKFAELQRRRRALESTSEESLITKQYNSIQDSLRRYEKHKHPRHDKPSHAHRKLFQSDQTLAEHTTEETPPPLPKQPPPPLKELRSSSQGATSSSQDEYANEFLMEMKKRLKSVRKSQEDVRYEEKTEARNTDIMVNREIKGVSQGRTMSPYNTHKSEGSKQQHDEVFVDGHHGSHKVIDRSSSVESRNTPTSQVSDGSAGRRLDAKSIVLEERRKFEDYKREYVRRMSSKESTSEGEDRGNEPVTSPTHSSGPDQTTVTHNSGLDPDQPPGPITSTCTSLYATMTTQSNLIPSSSSLLLLSSSSQLDVSLSNQSHDHQSADLFLSHGRKNPVERPHIPPDEYEYILRKIHHTPQHNAPEHAHKTQEARAPATTMPNKPSDQERSQGEYVGSYWLESDSYLEKQKQKLYNKHKVTMSPPATQSDTQKYMDVARQFSFNEDDSDKEKKRNQLQSKSLPLIDPEVQPPTSTQQPVRGHYDTKPDSEGLHYDWENERESQTHRKHTDYYDNSYYDNGQRNAPDYYEEHHYDNPYPRVSNYDNVVPGQPSNHEVAAQPAFQDGTKSQLPDFRNRRDVLKSWSETNIGGGQRHKTQQFDHRPEQYKPQATDHLATEHEYPSYHSDPKGRDYFSDHHPSHRHGDRKEHKDLRAYVPSDQRRAKVGDNMRNPYVSIDYSSHQRPPVPKPENVPKEPKYWQHNTMYQSVSPQHSPRGYSNQPGPHSQWDGTQPVPYSNEYNMSQPLNNQRPIYGSLDNLQPTGRESQSQRTLPLDTNQRYGNSLPRHAYPRHTDMYDYQPEYYRPGILQENYPHSADNRKYPDLTGPDKTYPETKQKYPDSSNQNYPAKTSAIQNYPDESGINQSYPDQTVQDRPVKSSQSSARLPYSHSNVPSYTKIAISHRDLSPQSSSHDNSFEQQSERSFQLEYRPKKPPRQLDGLPSDRDRYIREYIPEPDRYFKPISTNQQPSPLLVNQQASQMSANQQPSHASANKQPLHMLTNQHPQYISANQQPQYTSQPPVSSVNYPTSHHEPYQVQTHVSKSYPQSIPQVSRSEPVGDYPRSDHRDYPPYNQEPFAPVPIKSAESYHHEAPKGSDSYARMPGHAQVPVRSNDTYSQQPIRGTDTYLQQPMGSTDTYKQQPMTGTNTYSHQPIRMPESYSQPLERGPESFLQPVSQPDAYFQQSIRTDNSYSQQPIRGNETYSHQPIRADAPFVDQPMRDDKTYSQSMRDVVTYPQPMRDEDTYPQPMRDGETYSQVYPPGADDILEFPQQDQEMFTKQLSNKLQELGQTDPRFREYEEKMRKYKAANEKEPYLQPSQSQAANQYEAYIQDNKDKYKAKHGWRDGENERREDDKEYVDLRTIRQRKEVFEDIRQRQLLRSRSLPRDPGGAREPSPPSRPTHGGERRSRRPDPPSTTEPYKVTDRAEPTAFERKVKTTQSFRYSPERKYSPPKEADTTTKKPKKYEVPIQIPQCRYVLRPSRSAENLNKMCDDLPGVSVQDIKERLFGPNVRSKKAAVPTNRQEVDELINQQKVKVESVKGIFSQPIQTVPTYASVYRSTSSVTDGNKDELIYNYASYRDTPSKKKLNIFDDLTDLEATYERLNLNTEESGGGPSDGGLVDGDPVDTSVKRLSISNVRKFEEMLERRMAEQGQDRTTQWLRSGPTQQNNQSSPMTQQNTPLSPNEQNTQLSLSEIQTNVTQVTDEGPRSYARSSLPRKKADDMAYRKTHQMSLQSASLPMFAATGSYLSNSGSVDNVPVKSTSYSKSQSPDPIDETLKYRGYERTDKKADTTDDWRGRSTEVRRHRLRSLPDNLYDNSITKTTDVQPTISQVTVSIKKRSQSLDRRTDKQEAGSELRRTNSFGKGTDEKPISHGIATMVKLFTSPQEVTQSAPDLTKVGTVFSNKYNLDGDLVSEDPKYKHAVKPKKSYTPRDVKMRSEMKSKLKSLKTSGDSGFCPESESDGYSSSDQFLRQPPDGAFDSDECDMLGKKSSSSSPEHKKPGYKATAKSRPAHAGNVNSNNNNSYSRATTKTPPSPLTTSRNSSKTPPSPTIKTEMKVQLTPPSMRKNMATEESAPIVTDHVTTTIVGRSDESSGIVSKAVRPSTMDFNRMKRKQFFQELSMKSPTSKQQATHKSPVREFITHKSPVREFITHKSPVRKEEDATFAAQMSQLKYIDDVIESSVVRATPTETCEVVEISPDSPPISGDSQKPRLSLNRDMLRRRDSSPDTVSQPERKVEVTLVKPKPYPFSMGNTEQEDQSSRAVIKPDLKHRAEFTPGQLKAPPCDDIGNQLDRELQAARERLTAKLSSRVMEETRLKTRSQDHLYREPDTGRRGNEEIKDGNGTETMVTRQLPRYSWSDTKSQSSVQPLPSGEQTVNKKSVKEGFTEERDGFQRQVNREQVHIVRRRVQVTREPVYPGNEWKNLAKVEPTMHLSVPLSPSGQELSDGEMTDATDITLDSMVRANLRPLSFETLPNVSARETDSSSTTSENSQKEYIVSEGIKRRPKVVKVIDPSLQSEPITVHVQNFDQSEPVSQLVVSSKHSEHFVSSVVTDQSSSQSKTVFQSSSSSSQSEGRTVEQEDASSSQSQYKRESKKEMRDERRLSLKERVQLFEDQASPFLKGPRVYDENK